jgi:hypothetical protein
MRTCRSCGCTDDHPCATGCVWIEPDLCSSCVDWSAALGRELPPRELLEARVSIELSLLDMLVLHGCLCLALRHPAYTGASRAWAEVLRDYFGEALVDAAVLTPEQLAEANALEVKEAPRVILARG